MPNNKIVIETDGDPKTAYEDTTVHERTGFIVDDAEESGADNKKQINDNGNR
ncbi:hypothetical protein FHS15_004103 [Paenibacillus castaneae]|uniref:hypothetical protein n=1 Tax=Paenibacillus castaneae TaxID=474957 RepID=UPI00141B268B|nr:hypothetical protein [Paenibacillus castaneae]NIK78957.1 hypothetical protein [Paenibacillus castaneae]